MCGISGEIRFDGRDVSPNPLYQINEQLTPRGPEGSGFLMHGPLGFAHRRLKIMDLSEHAQQPMFDAELGLGIVFNGAIYNFRELRSELQSKGHHFFSSGDTEVVLKAYKQWGENCLSRLNGMFAFAIWDRDTREVFFARDRLGIKPLYYTRNQDSIRFSSTLTSLLSSGDIDTSIDPVALHYYMNFHAVVPAPHTLIKGVRKLEPGSWMKISAAGETKQDRYWFPEYGQKGEEKNFSFNDWKEKVAEALSQAVQRRLVADVPVGVLLSGGLDSSLIVGLLAKYHNTTVKTFSIGFESVREEKGDEFEYSDIIVDRFKTDHTKIFVEGSKALSTLEAVVKNMSEPMVSHDNIGFYLLSQEVSKHVKVVQSGQGADEVFAGYHWYPPMVNCKDPVEEYARVFCDRSHDEYAEAINAEFVSEDFSRKFIAEHFGLPGANEAVDKALRLDSLIMLVDDPVKRVDNNTMAWGLEARVPFLDHELVELAARVPAEYKLKNGGKYILQEIARDVIPAEVIDRPKGYFPVPALKYIQGDYLDFVRGILENKKTQDRGLLRKPYIDKLLANPTEHITPLRGSKLWQITVLEYWMQLHGI